MKKYDPYRITDNIRSFSLYNDSDPETIPVLQKDSYCFLIAFQRCDEANIRRFAQKLARGGCVYFLLFGDQSDIWLRELQNCVHSESVFFKHSPTEFTKFMDEIAVSGLITNDTQPVQLIHYSGDFLWECKQDVKNTFRELPPVDPALFDNGMEFRYRDSDCVVSIGRDVLLGPLGKEQSFPTRAKAFAAPVFDGRNLLEIWREINGLRVIRSMKDLKKDPES